MAITNHDRVGKALELLNQGLKAFVERELKNVWGERFMAGAGRSRASPRPAGGADLTAPTLSEKLNA